MIGGLGAEPPAGSRGSAPVGVQARARAFSQSELPRKPPIDTHGRYTCNTCTHKKQKTKKIKTSEKVGIPTKVGKTASLYIHERMLLEVNKQKLQNLTFLLYLSSFPH